jgi:hypothetical protein
VQHADFPRNFAQRGRVLFRRTRCRFETVDQTRGIADRVERLKKAIDSRCCRSRAGWIIGNFDDTDPFNQARQGRGVGQLSHIWIQLAAVKDDAADGYFARAQHHNGHSDVIQSTETGAGYDHGVQGARLR